MENNKTGSSKMLLSRSRIDMKLYEAIKHPVVTVTAGTGYGKTSSVSSFLNKSNLTTVWLSLTRLDNISSRFWERLTKSIGDIDEEKKESLLELGFPDTLSKFDTFARIFASEIYSGREVVLVLDDYGSIDNQEISAFVENLILTNLEYFCIVLISRTKVSISTTVLNDPEALYQINGDDLKFTKEETSALLRLCGIELEEEEEKYVHEHTEGWPLAIHLAALHFEKNQDNDNDLGKIFYSSISHILNIFEVEFFSNYTFEMQKLLMRMSLLEGCAISTIKKLTEIDMREVLSVLDSNLFINYDNVSQVFIFHNLYKDFLKQKQIYLTDDEVKDTYNTVADWCLENQQKVAAVTYYSNAGNHQKIYEIIKTNPNKRLQRDLADFYYEHLCNMPEEFVEAHPFVEHLKASFLLNNSQVEEAYNQFMELKDKWEGKGDFPKVKALLGEIYLSLADISMARQSHDFVEYYKKAAECMPDGSKNRQKTLLFIQNNDVMFLTSSEEGNIEKVQQDLFEARPYFETVMNGCGYGFEYLFAAEAAYYTCNLTEAKQFAYKAMYKSKEEDQYDIYCNALIVLLKVNVYKGNYEGMRDCLEKIKDCIEKNKVSELSVLADYIEGYYYILLGDVSKVARWVMDDNLADQIQSPIDIGRDRMLRARCFLHNGDYFEMIAMLEQLEPVFIKRGLWIVLLDIYILLSIGYYKTQQMETASAYFKKAYDMTVKNSVITPFIQEGNYMRALIKAVQEMPDLGINAEWMDMISAKSATYAKRLSTIISEYSNAAKTPEASQINLSKRELEVLCSLAQGLTREEISSYHRISINTVKSTIKRIYNKLGAVNCSDAVHIATKLEIIS